MAARRSGGTGDGREVDKKVGTKACHDQAIQRVREPVRDTGRLLVRRGEAGDRAVGRIGCREGGSRQGSMAEAETVTCLIAAHGQPRRRREKGEGGCGARSFDRDRNG